jgi:hypothetical protein
MFSSAFSAALRFVLKSACPLLAALFAMFPVDVAAQQTGFLVITDFTSSKSVYLWTASCPNLRVNNSPSDMQEKVVCTFERTTCAPESCAFNKKSTDSPPLALTFGKSSHNPTCAWVFNWTSWSYAYRCW